MAIRHAILATILFGALPGTAGAQGIERCERDFRQCATACGAGPSGPCTEACYAERAMCIQNPSRPPQQSRLPR